MRFINNLAPADELKWLTDQQVRLSRRLGSIPPLGMFPVGDHDRLQQAYRHLQVREAPLLAALGGQEWCRTTIAILHTWPRIRF